MGYVDVSTGKIVGVKEGTLTWLHEKGHIEFSKLELSIKNSFREYFYLRLGVTFGILSYLNPFFLFCASVFIVLTWYYYFYEEIWCWRYAFKKKKEIESKGGIV